VFDIVSYFHPSLIFAGKAGAYSSKAHNGAPLQGSKAMAKYIRLGWKWQTVTNALPRFDMELITAVESFIVQRPKKLKATKLLNKG